MGTKQLCKEFGDLAHRLSEAEYSISTLEDELYQINSTLQQHFQIHSAIQEKLEDL